MIIYLMHCSLIGLFIQAKGRLVLVMIRPLIHLINMLNIRSETKTTHFLFFRLEDFLVDIYIHKTGRKKYSPHSPIS